MGGDIDSQSSHFLVLELEVHKQELTICIELNFRCDVQLFTRMKTPPPFAFTSRFRSFLKTLYVSGNTLQFMVPAFSHDSVPSTTSGSVESKKVWNSAILLFILWQFRIDILKLSFLCGLLGGFTDGVLVKMLLAGIPLDVLSMNHNAERRSFPLTIGDTGDIGVASEFDWLFIFSSNQLVPSRDYCWRKLQGV